MPKIGVKSNVFVSNVAEIAKVELISIKRPIVDFGNANGAIVALVLLDIARSKAVYQECGIASIVQPRGPFPIQNCNASRRIAVRIDAGTAMHEHGHRTWAVSAIRQV